MREQIIEHVMSVFDYSRDEAVAEILDTAEQLICSDPFDSYDILMDNLCLEPDYIMDIIEFLGCEVL